MKIEYVSHACLLVDTGREKILFDPWVIGPAYNNQWHLFPKPVNTERLKENIDFILITHGHEDHLHEASLRILPKTAKVFFPYTWYGEATSYFHSQGFKNISEVTSWRRIKISSDTYITYISHNLDSIIVLEANGEVLVNLNDALVSHNEETINFFTQRIKQRWKNIHYLFSGFGGASYFPNTIHAPFKDDLEIAGLREQLFVENFFKIVNDLQPKIAIPFAADFVLLDKENIWINKVKDSKVTLIEKYYHYFPEKKGLINVLPMYSGDILENFKMEKNSVFHTVKEQDYEKLIIEEYETIIESKANPKFVSEEVAEQLASKIFEQINRRKDRFKYYAEKMKNLQFDIKLTNVQTRNYYHVSIVNSYVSVERFNIKQDSSIVQIDIRSEDLLYSFAGDWTGDVINIGYCLQVYISDEKDVVSGLEGLCVKLLTNHPNEDEYVTKPSFRALKFIWSNPIHKDWFVKKVLKKKEINLRERLYQNDNTYNRPVWLTKNKCQICEICKLPNRDKEIIAG